MPRPKRAKIEPSAPTLIPIKFPATRNTRENAPHQPSSRTGTTSEDSDGIITRNKTGTNNKGVPKQHQYMSGALAVRDPSEKHSRPPRGRERAALSRIAREADHAKAIEALQKRRDEALARAAAEKTKESVVTTAALEQEVVPSSMPEADRAITQAKTLDETVDKLIKEIQPTAPILKAPATPLAETSVLALANFKRRPRQPSLLQISQPKEDVGNDDDDEDGMDDFEPDDESTPFRLSISRSQIPQTPTAQELFLPPSSQRQSTGSRKRKLTPPQLQVQRSQDAVPAPQPDLPITISSRSPSPSTHEPSSSPPTPAAATTPEPALPSLRRQSQPSRQKQPSQPQSDTLAPPRSTSAPPTQAPSPSAPSPQKLPSHKPDRVRKSKKNPGPSPLKPISTASLQNLLPRRKKRRQRGRENEMFELLSSGDLHDVSSDVDELSYHAPPSKAKLNPRLGRAAGDENTMVAPKKGKAKASSTFVAKATKLNAQSKPSKPKPAHPKPKTIAPKPAQKPTPRTYGQASKPTDPQPSSSSLSEPESVSSPTQGTSPPTDLSKNGKAGSRHEVGTKEARKEFKSLVQKFKEVDAWELSFEEVTASSSSPADAR